MDDVRARTILITGGAGFIGSHLARELLDRGHRVLVLDDLSTGVASNVAPLVGRDGFRMTRGSILDQIVLDRLAAEANTIVHLAAAVGVQLVIDHPVQTIETNVGGTEAVLKAALRNGCKVLLASTSEVYGKGHKIPFGEGDDVLLGSTLRRRWLYAASKMVDEFLAFAYHTEYGLDVVAFRLFNTIGAGQTGRYGMVVPRLVRQALQGHPLTVYGDGTQSRCFCDVRDVVRAVAELAVRPDVVGELFNIGSTEEVTIMRLAERIVRLAGSSSSIVLHPYDEVFPEGFEDMQRRVPDTTRVRTLLNWRPNFSLDDTLQSVIAFERAALKT